MSNPIRDLERAAVRCHRAGEDWGDFWERHGPAVCKAEPYDRDAFIRLTRRLLALVISGNLDGRKPVNAVMPWDRDDRKPADVGTLAKCQLSLFEEVGAGS